MIVNIYAKIAQCEANYGDMEAGSITDIRPFGLDNRLYMPKYTKTKLTPLENEGVKRK